MLFIVEVQSAYDVPDEEGHEVVLWSFWWVKHLALTLHWMFTFLGYPEVCCNILLIGTGFFINALPDLSFKYHVLCWNLILLNWGNCYFDSDFIVTHDIERNLGFMEMLTCGIDICCVHILNRVLLYLALELVSACVVSSWSARP